MNAVFAQLIHALGRAVRGLIGHLRHRDAVPVAAALHTAGSGYQPRHVGSAGLDHVRGPSLSIPPPVAGGPARQLED